MTLRDYVEYPPTFIPQSGVACMDIISWHGWPTLQGSRFQTTPLGRQKLLSCEPAAQSKLLGVVCRDTKAAPCLSWSLSQCCSPRWLYLKLEATPRSGLTFPVFFSLHTSLYKLSYIVFLLIFPPTLFTHVYPNS